MKQMEQDFVTWLNEELKVRDWSQSELARRCGVTAPAINRILSGQRTPSTDICISIARALGVSPENVLRRAGILPRAFEELVEKDPDLREIVNLMRGLSPATRHELLAYVRFRAASEAVSTQD